jgi:hypothetical protein
MHFTRQFLNKTWQIQLRLHLFILWAIFLFSFTLRKTRVYPKYSWLVPPSIQQLWCRESPVSDRTTMYSKSVCQVTRNWVDVGSSLTRLLMRFMNFTASVRNVLYSPSYLLIFYKIGLTDFFYTYPQLHIQIFKTSIFSDVLKFQHH